MESNRLNAPLDSDEINLQEEEMLDQILDQTLSEKERMFAHLSHLPARDLKKDKHIVSHPRGVAEARIEFSEKASDIHQARTGRPLIVSANLFAYI